MGYEWVQTSHSSEALSTQSAIFKTMSHQVDTILDEQGIDIDKESDSYHQLCRDMLKASIQGAGGREGKRTYGDYATSGTDEQVVGRLSAPKEWPTQSQPIVERLSHQYGLQDLISDYQDERVKAGRWKEGTIRNYQPLFATMTQYLGAETQVNTITRPQMVDYKKLLSSLPPGFARLKKYKDISGLTLEAIEDKHNKQMDITTLRSYIQMAESVFSFGVRNGYMDKNPAEGLKPPKKKQTREQRQAFDEEDLQKLFHSDLYLKDKHTKPYQFWLPVLGLYTGCRLEELAQLPKG
jgi:hypothetical protein